MKITINDETLRAAAALGEQFQTALLGMAPALAQAADEATKRAANIDAGLAAAGLMRHGAWLTEPTPRTKRRMPPRKRRSGITGKNKTVSWLHKRHEDHGRRR